MVRTVVLAIGTLIAFSATSRAEYIIDISQAGPNVVAKGHGTLDTAALTSVPVSDTGLGVFGINASSAFAVVGNYNLGDQTYTGFSGPTTFGPGWYTFANGPGLPTGINGSSDYLVTPLNYSSGDPLSGSMEFDGTTIAGLGLTPGTYTWTWGSGDTADSFVIRIHGHVTPEPASLTMLGTALAAFGGLRLRRRKQRTGEPGSR
jgi:hypothetical protein